MSSEKISEIRESLLRYLSENTKESNTIAESNIIPTETSGDNIIRYNPVIYNRYYPNNINQYNRNIIPDFENNKRNE